MQTSATITEIAKAIIAVMKTVKGIDKNLNVGSGTNSYKGVSDQDVKKEIGKAMESNGLCLIPTDVEPTLQIDRWEQEEFYNGKSNGVKQKQSVFTSVKTKYLLIHESGEWIEVSGYGHGTDTQDKAAGKATTYALKYAMLYMFMVPTGKIDDADATHSDEIQSPKTNGIQVKDIPKKQKLSDKAFGDALKRIDAGENQLAVKLNETYELNAEQKMILEERLDTAKV